VAELPDHTYTDAQLDGFACIDCGEQGGAMVPAGEGPRGQLFRHRSHQYPAAVEVDAAEARRASRDDDDRDGMVCT
jgi:hypothetical protein